MIVATTFPSQVGVPQVGNPAPQSNPATMTERAFVPPQDRVALLPFFVRMERLSTVTGVPLSDSIYGELVSHRLDLGAHDFGSNVAADLSWSAQKMVTWAKAVTPVCEDGRLKTKYPNWSSQLDAFALSAWGRPATPEDRESLIAVAGDAPLGAASEWKAVCITLLSSMEMLTQ
jgi:hypothetical protein